MVVRAGPHPFWRLDKSEQVFVAKLGGQRGGRAPAHVGQVREVAKVAQQQPRGAAAAKEDGQVEGRGAPPRRGRGYAAVGAVAEKELDGLADAERGGPV